MDIIYKFSFLKCVKYLFRGLGLSLRCVLKFSIIKKKIAGGQLFFLLSLHMSVTLTKILSAIECILCSINIVGLKIFEVNQVLVIGSKNSFSCFLLSKLSKLTLKSPVNITFPFSLDRILNVCFKHHKNSDHFFFGYP